MKLIYKTSMVNIIDEEICKAKMIDNEIVKIILTQEEWKELRKDLQLLCTQTVPHYPTELYVLGGALEGAEASYRGIPIFVGVK